jgi:hypothetical protein
VTDSATPAEKPQARLPTLPPCGQITPAIAAGFFRHLTDAGVILLEHRPNPAAWAAYMAEFTKGDLWQLAQQAKRDGNLPTLSVCLARMQAARAPEPATPSGCHSRQASTITGTATATAASASPNEGETLRPTSPSSSRKPEAEPADRP